MPRPRSDIAPRIIEAARRRFLTEGVDGASLRRIARDAGTSIGMIYYYFPTKDDLFSAVVEDVYAGLLRDLSAVLESNASVEERLRQLYARLGAMTDDEFTVIRIVIREALISTSRLQRVAELMARGHVPLVLQTVMEGTRDGTLTDRQPFPVLMASLATLAIIPQVAIRRVTEEGVHLAIGTLPSPPELAARCMDVLMHGIGGPASESGAADDDGDDVGHG